ncbi:fimbrial protein [Serratia liquefaciens]|uniref:fimbrial protein n=1 Tax=Serratia liquefaciens TaxID=614 RepID=UPI00217ADF26|nr:fimbrial protein [Serratia liquefaciens]CAI1194786.1 putative minor fimbrial subunit StfF [Serratia liquefaciens]
MKNNNIWRRAVLAVVVLGSLWVNLPLQADNMSFHGRLIEQAPCTVNSGEDISVDFGSELLTTKIDGNNYIKTVDYSLVCKGNTRNTMKMKVQGNATTFNASALQTNMADLGISLRAKGAALAINNWVNFTYPDKPVLQAVPVMRAGSTLSGGDFMAAATLMVSYQ